MPDEVTVSPPVETPAAPPTPDPLDSVKKEVESIKSAFEQERAAWAQERQAYAQQLGQLVSRQQAPPPSTTQTDPDSFFDADTAKHVRMTARKEAEQIAYSLLGRAQVLQEVNGNSELEKLAAQELQSLNQNPFYANLSDDHKLTLAVKEAQLKVLRKQQSATQQQTAQQALAQAAQAQAAGASLPGTGNAAPSTNARTFEEYFKEFSSDPVNRQFVKKWAHVDPDSPQGQAELKNAAKANWDGIAITGAAGTAIEILGGRR